MRRFLIPLSAAAALLASFAAATAQQPMPRVQVGLLECPEDPVLRILGNADARIRDVQK